MTDLFGDRSARPSDDTPAPRSLGRRVFHGLIAGLLPFVVLAIGAYVAWYLITSGPQAKRKGRKPLATRVEATAISFATERVHVHGAGTVRAARRIELRPRVSGQIESVSDDFVPGGRFDRDAMIVQIDDADYTLALKQRKAEVLQAQSDIRLERGRQVIAKREYELLGEKIDERDRALVLREPQLRVVEAKLVVAQAARDRAQLDFERTSITAPFNAVVLTRNVERGAYVSPATSLATLAGTDSYWVEVAVPVDSLRWIQIPATKSEVGSTVHLRDESAWGSTDKRVGRVLRLAGDLEREGRLARLIVEVDDPLTLAPKNAGKPRMLIGAYLSAEILGRRVPNVVAIRREWLHGDHVHLLTNTNTLAIRKVTIAFRGRDRIFVSDGLANGDHVITSRIAAPIADMPLRLASPKASRKRPAEERANR